MKEKIVNVHEDTKKIIHKKIDTCGKDVRHMYIVDKIFNMGREDILYR